MIRIKYTEIDKIHISDPMIGNGNLLIIVLDIGKLKYTIENANRTIIFDKGSANTLDFLRRKAKKALQEQGVVFNSEVRKVNER